MSDQVLLALIAAAVTIVMPLITALCAYLLARHQTNLIESRVLPTIREVTVKNALDESILPPKI